MNIDKIHDFRSRISEELIEKCETILELLDEYLVPVTHSEEALAFYFKIKADQNRYIAEQYTGKQRKQATDDSLAAYTYAYDLAQKSLPTTHPTRLGLALNFSVFELELRGDP